MCAHTCITVIILGGGGGGGGASYKSITAVTDYMGFSFTCRPRRSQRGDTPLLLGTTSTSSSTRRGCSLNSRKLAEGTLARSSKGVYNVMYPFLLSCVCVYSGMWQLPENISCYIWTFLERLEF